MERGKSSADVGQATATPLLSPLTRREQEVLELMAFGLANKEIADKLSLSRRTVESHIDHLLGKLNAPTRARAVVEAGRAGLLGGQTLKNPADSADDRPNNLPLQLTTLLGRERDLVEVKSLLEAHRLVTLTGSGGVGKTRLALRVGVDLLDMFPDGAWSCDFSPISDPLLVAGTVARALVVREQQNRPLVDSIVEALKRKRALLLFDNCEHVVDRTAELADEVLHTCPNIRILATSRQALGIMGEVVYRVRSLSLPDSGEGLKAVEGLAYGAIALFVDRAQASDARFAFTDENAAIVAEICGRLDGIPLAIELAATRSNVINLHTLARSLDDRFKLLAGGRTALPRHKTLSALIDWSYALLSPREKALFRRLGVFAGGFSLAAATAVCCGHGLEKVEILDLLASLTDKSLLVVETRGAQERFRMLESTRVYALEKLGAEGERERVARAHAVYFGDQAQIAEDRHGPSLTFAWLDSAELELDNYRVALEWGLHQEGDAVIGASIAGALVPLWYRGGLALEGTHWIELAIERIDAATHPLLAARLWRALAGLHSTKRCVEAAEQAMRLYTSVGDALGVALTLNSVVHGLRGMGRLDEAYESSVRALAALRTFGDQGGAAMCLLQQGLIAYAQGKVAQGRDAFAQALALYKVLGDEMGIAAVQVNLAELEFAEGHPELALRSGEEALEIFACRKAHAPGFAITQNNTAVYRLAAGDADGARSTARAALRSARKTQNALILATSVQTLALLTALSGHAQRAARLLSFVETKFKELGYTREPTEQWGHEKLVDTLREYLSETETGKLAAEGAAWSEDQVVEEALKL